VPETQETARFARNCQQLPASASCHCKRRCSFSREAMRVRAASSGAPRGRGRGASGAVCRAGSRDKPNTERADPHEGGAGVGRDQCDR
jgi:hypothetical protein